MRRGIRIRGKKSNKFRAVKTEVDGIKFPSKLEAAEYVKLRDRRDAGEIRDLRLQVPYRLAIGTAKVCTYIADYVYVEAATGQEVVADAKGMLTGIYRLKKKLMMALLGIQILELPERPQKPRKRVAKLVRKPKPPLPKKRP